MASRRKVKKRNLGIVMLALVLLISVVVVLFIKKPWQSKSLETTDEQKQENQVSKEDAQNIRLSFVGDLLIHDSLNESAYNKETDTYDYSSFFEYITPYTKDSDIWFANLETTFSGGDIPYAGYPLFNTPDDFLKSIEEAGIDLLNTTNNHAFDYGPEGLVRTAEVIEASNVDHIGTYSSPPTSRIYLREVKGVKIAFLTYAEMFNGLGDPAENAEFFAKYANFMDKDVILEDIEEAKEKGADLIVANMHWGEEYQTEPNNKQREYTQLLVEQGVDLVIGGHPHVIQPAEVVEYGGNKGFVIYSVGNFVSNQRVETLGPDKESSEDGVIIQTDIKVEDGDLTLSNVELIPTWVYRDEKSDNQSEYVYHVLSVDEFIDNPQFAEKYLDRIKESKKRTEDVLGMYGIYDETFGFKIGVDD